MLAEVGQLVVVRIILAVAVEVAGHIRAELDEFIQRPFIVTHQFIEVGVGLLGLPDRLVEEND